MPRVGLVLLAAGGSARLGRPKQLVLYRSKTLLRRAAEAVIASGCDPIVVVLGAVIEEAQAELSGLKLKVVINSDWESGMSSSIRRGLNALEPDVDAAVIMACDQPHLTSDHLSQLASEHCLAPTLAIASEYGGVAGVPALFPRCFFDELCNLPAEQGARSLLKRHSDQVKRVPFPGGAVDVDSPNDIESLLAS